MSRQQRHRLAELVVPREFSSSVRFQRGVRWIGVGFGCWQQKLVLQGENGRQHVRSCRDPMREGVSVSTAGPIGSTGEPTQADHGPRGGIYLAFVPWVLFTLIAQHDTLKAAAIVGLIAAVVIAARSVLAGHPKLLEMGAVLAFVGFTVAAFIADPSATQWLERYARAIAALLLALIAFSSLLFVPFTEQYARESVPRQFWSSPRFKQINRQVTLLWGCVFVAMTVSHVIAGAIDTRRGNTIFNWVVPVLLIIWAVKRTGELSSPEVR
jgi:hypothetical protein